MISVLADASAALAWRQWTALGVAGAADVPDHAVDLEALIGFTPILAKHDPRLVDEALDWCIHHAQRRVSLARLNSMMLYPRVRDHVNSFAAKVDAAGTHRSRWSKDQLEIPPPPRTSGKSRAPSIDLPALLQLRLRALFGIQARAEVLLQFLRPLMSAEPLAGRELLASLIDVGYSRPTIYEALHDLADSGVIERWSHPQLAALERYTLERPDALRAIVGNQLPASAPNWRRRFAVAAELLAAEQDHRDKRQITRTVEIANALARSSSSLKKLRIKAPTGIEDWDELGRWAAEALLAK